MLTGKTRMLKTKRELFMRQRSGNVIPVFTYLFVNNMSRKHMILMFEPNSNLKIFDEPHHKDAYSFLLTNNTFSIGEISNSFDKVTGVSKQALNLLTEELDRGLNCDDLIKVRSLDCEIQQIQDIQDMNEIEVSFKGVNQRFLLSHENNFGNLNLQKANSDMNSNSDE